MPNNSNFNIRVSFLINHIGAVLNTYSYPTPFHLFLKTYFNSHKQLGSKDRKIIKSACYALFRMGKQFQKESIETQLAIISKQFSNVDPNLLLFENETLSNHIQFDINQSWAFESQLSKSVDKSNFITSLLKQTKIWFWNQTNVPYPFIEHMDRKIYYLDQAQNMTVQDSKIVFQDYASQFVSSLIKINYKDVVWDCCAASGGKSLNIAQYNSIFTHLASDIRATILSNLEERFKVLNLTKPYIAEIDLKEQKSSYIFKRNTQIYELKHGTCDVIIADVPCSGSGTFGRNPEHLPNFDEAVLTDLVILQNQILDHIAPFSKPGSFIYYFTCSVFYIENEGVISSFLTKNNTFELIEQNTISHELGSDTMFYAILKAK